MICLFSYIILWMHIFKLKSKVKPFYENYIWIAMKIIKLSSLIIDFSDFSRVYFGTYACKRNKKVVDKQNSI